MARQGNYVTVPGASSNWASGTSGALADLSRTLLSQSEAEKERERAAAAEAENKRRYEEGKAYRTSRDVLADGRYQNAEDLKRKDRKRLSDKREWLKNVPSAYDTRTLQERKVEQLGYSLDEIPESKRDEVIEKVPLYREDVERYLGTDYMSRFGEAADPTSFASLTERLPSIKALQEKEQTRTREEQAQANKEAEFLLRRSQLFKSPSESGSSSKSRKASPKSLTDISATALAKPYEGNSWFNPFDSEKQEVVGVVTNLIDSFKDTPLAGNPRAVQAGIEYTLDRLTEGGELDEVRYDLDEAEKLATEGANLYLSTASRVNRGSSGIAGTTSAVPDRLLRLSPTDIRQQRLDEWKASFLEQTAPIETSSAGTSPPLQGRAVLENLRVAPEPAVVERQNVPVARTVSTTPETVDSADRVDALLEGTDQEVAERLSSYLDGLRREQLPTGLEGFRSMLGNTPAPEPVRDTSTERDYIRAVESIPAYERRLEAARGQPARFYSQDRVDAYAEGLKELRNRIAKLRSML